MFTLLKCSRRCYVIRLLEFHLNTTYCSRSWVCSYQSQAWRLCACKAPGKTRGDSFILQLSRWRQGRRLFKLHDGLKNVLLENMTTKLETLDTKEYFRACRHVFHGRYFIYGYNYVPTIYKTLYSVPYYSSSRWPKLTPLLHDASEQAMVSVSGGIKVIIFTTNIL